MSSLKRLRSLVDMPDRSPNTQPRKKAKRGHGLIDLDLLGQHTQALEQKIELIRKTGDASALNAALVAAQQSLVQLKTFIDGSPKYDSPSPGPVPDKSSELAKAVFHVPELAEEVFTYLDPLDVLNVLQTDRRINNIVQSSSKLQKHLFLLPDEATYFRSLQDYDLIHTSSSRMRLSANRLPSKSQQNVVEVVALFSKNPSMVSRLQDMQVSQPAVRSMRYSASCCGRPRFYGARSGHYQGETRVIKNPGGLTLGELLKAAKKMMEDHELCVHAGSFGYHRDGSVRSDIHFSGKVELQSSDPLFVEMSKHEEEERQRKLFRRKLELYTQAKQDAHVRGLPIPSLAEFEASTAEEDAGHG